MANRVDEADVSAILDNTTLTDQQILAYINSANATINNALADSGLSSDILFEIERWLSAHMISITRERMAKKEEAGSAKIEYIGVYGKGLELTPYGQMVLDLDTTGIMASLGGKSATIYAIPESHD